MESMVMGSNPSVSAFGESLNLLGFPYFMPACGNFGKLLSVRLEW